MTALQQIAPYPQALADLVARVEYRPGWKFSLEDTDRGQGSEGLTLKILSLGYDTYHPERGENYRVWHYMPVPPAAYDKQSWQRWLLEQVLLIERHEACEFFQVDGERPYAPTHGPGSDPYRIVEYAEDIDRRTRYTGEVKDH